MPRGLEHRGVVAHSTLNDDGECTSQVARLATDTGLLTPTSIFPPADLPQ